MTEQMCLSTDSNFTCGELTEFSETFCFTPEYEERISLL